MRGPTVLSTFLGLIVMALVGPMALLSTVGGDRCQDPIDPSQAVRCESLLVDQDFWMQIAAKGAAGFASPWDDLAPLLLTMFGMPQLQAILTKRKEADDGALQS